MLSILSHSVFSKIMWICQDNIGSISQYEEWIRRNSTAHIVIHVKPVLLSELILAVLLV